MRWPGWGLLYKLGQSTLSGDFGHGHGHGHVYGQNVRIGTTLKTERVSTLSSKLLRLLFLRLVCALSVCAWCGPALAQTARPVRLLKGPYLTGLYDSGADVRFELDGPAAATVEVDRGASDGGARTFEDRAKTTMHVLRATDLASATSYAYVVRVGGRELARGRFTTAPAQESGA